MKKSQFLSLDARMAQNLENLMAPKHLPGRLVFRTHLSRRFTNAGTPTLVSQFGRHFGLYPWETRLMAFADLEARV